MAALVNPCSHVVDNPCKVQIHSGCGCAGGSSRVMLSKQCHQADPLDLPRRYNACRPLPPNMWASVWICAYLQRGLQCLYEADQIRHHCMTFWFCQHPWSPQGGASRLHLTSYCYIRQQCSERRIRQPAACCRLFRLRSAPGARCPSNLPPCSCICHPTALPPRLSGRNGARHHGHRSCSPAPR